jgi:phospholipid-binding lipoprotein MlaA
MANRHSLRIKTYRLIFIALFTSFLVGCVSMPENSVPSKKDPWEHFNRNVYQFNETLDDYLIRPITKAYEFVLPEFVRNAFSNIFSNVGDVYTAVNQLLQGKPYQAASDVSRVIANTTFGIGGIFDVASYFGLEKHNEDFGQTFGVWGAGDGPYMVLPFLGPSNVRDTVGWVFDLETDILLSYIDNIPLRNTITGVRVVDQRSKYLNSSSLLETAAFDKYTFVRDAYTQRRWDRIYDGNPPLMIDEDDEEMTPLKEGEEKRIR